MIDFYVKLVKKGKITIEQVPIKYRNEVRKALETN